VSIAYRLQAFTPSPKAQGRPKMNNQYKQLTLKERYQLEDLNLLWFLARAIATKMERSNKVITRELREHAIKSVT